MEHDHIALLDSVGLEGAIGLQFVAVVEAIHEGGIHLNPLLPEEWHMVLDKNGGLVGQRKHAADNNTAAVDKNIGTQ